MSRDSKGGSSKYAVLTGGKTSKKPVKKPVKKSVRKTVKRSKGGSGVHLTYGDEKYICHREDTLGEIPEDDLATPGVNESSSAGELQKVEDSIKEFVKANTDTSGEESGTTSSDNVTTPDDTTTVNQEGGGRRRKTKKLTKPKPKTKPKTKPKRKTKKGGTGCALKEGGAKKKKKVEKKKSRRRLYMEYLDKKYSKDQLMKICKKLDIKITIRKKGNIKPIKKETLIKKITVLKFNK